MHTHDLEPWIHDHVFEQDRKIEGERRTQIVVVITVVMMVLEVSAGVAFGSMALLADGVHMGSHSVALGLTAFAYAMSRRYATDRRFTFGVGKINSLAAFTSAILLLGFAAAILIESLQRLVAPVPISFAPAMIVAVLGLLVNGGSAWLLGHASGDGHHHAPGGHTHHAHDHNLRSAYLHVLADALTSVLAIVALLAGFLWGVAWLDPVMGLVGAALVGRWGVGLVKDTARTLLDCQANDDAVELLRAAIEDGTSDRVADLHMWNLGPGRCAAELRVVSDTPRSPQFYRARIPESLGIVHSTIEVHSCA